MIVGMPTKADIRCSLVASNHETEALTDVCLRELELGQITTFLTAQP
jgi:hypothetical protein